MWLWQIVQEHWEGGLVGALISIPFAIASSILALIKLRVNSRKEWRRLRDELNEYLIQLSPPTLSGDELAAAKYRYYGAFVGHHVVRRLDPFENIVLGFPAEREINETVIELIRQSNRRFIHIELLGSRQSGRTTSIIQLGRKLSQEKNTEVLLLSGDIKDKGRELMQRYVKNRAKIVPNNTSKSLAILLDDLDNNWDKFSSQKEYLRPARKLLELARQHAQHSRTIFISSSLSRLGEADSVALEITLTEKDEYAIRTKILEEPSIPLGSGELLLENIWGEFGGGQQYNGQLSAFLSIFANQMHGARYEQGTNEFVSILKNSNHLAAVQLLAVFQLVSVKVPRNFLAVAVDGVDWHDLLMSSEDFIREESVLNPNRGLLALTSPFMAGRILQGLNVNNEEDIVSILTPAIKRWSSCELEEDQIEVLRHLLHRLAGARKFSFLRLDDGRKIALRAITGLRKSVGDFLKSSDDVGCLCRWASTLAQLDEINLLRSTVVRIAESQISHLSDPQAFVSFSKALVKLKSTNIDSDASIVRRGASKLQLKKIFEAKALQWPEEPGWQRRANETLHSYCRLLSRQNRHQELLNCHLLARDIFPDLKFDAMNILAHAKALQRLGRPMAYPFYHTALDVASRSNNIRENPRDFIECAWSLIKYEVTRLDESAVGSKPQQQDMMRWVANLCCTVFERHRIWRVVTRTEIVKQNIVGLFSSFMIREDLEGEMRERIISLAALAVAANLTKHKERCDFILDIAYGIEKQVTGLYPVLGANRTRGLLLVLSWMIKNADPKPESRPVVDHITSLFRHNKEMLDGREYIEAVKEAARNNPALHEVVNTLIKLSQSRRPRS